MDMNFGTAITLALIALALIPTVRHLVGKGGSSCDNCNGSCNGCNAADKMVRDMKRAERKQARRMRKQMRVRSAGARNA
ncbi:MAG: hypothetical protein PUE02_01850 [Eggerthellaceae bacterium]|nr:hypothetical protein [Eggerthellaceae bacterium]